MALGHQVDRTEVRRQACAERHTTGRKTIRHPEIGDILLDCDVLIVPGADLRMVTYTAAAGSEDAGKLDLLRVTEGRAAHRTRRAGLSGDQDASESGVISSMVGK
ncbi:hypothetical protein [Planomonospora venezuelensis]|uniref:MmyB-like transcription regulator ligand binding domain-containing protein n=1 Tax=Planomonospora venezuelensis TaxID=1999 RepID=A0A841DB92_PLAVE|nr:hypothetical protein [Planomonospora venezuelensis]MBB5966759.1 hypothetical protein [Planomonospora venezuelensis]GIN01738.1 hypothetical protein Pve01_33960 [Planomonospora venezuelensis]